MKITINLSQNEVKALVGALNTAKYFTLATRVKIAWVDAQLKTEPTDE